MQPSSVTPPTPGQAVLATCQQRFGFLTDTDVQTLATDDSTRLTQCLVRCGSCRFVASAQDVAHLISIIETDGRDYVRDVSLVARER